MKRVLTTAFLCLFCCNACAESRPITLGYQIVNVYPHDRQAFTQGLFYRDGWLYESTGLRGSSSVRQVHLETGRIARQIELESKYFGEGIVDWNDSLIAVTWHAGRGFVLALDDFTEQGQFKYSGEGWGLTRNDSLLILSDGTPKLRFLDPETFQIEKTITVALNGQTLRNLNELEWVEDAILANVWKTDSVVRIDPESGNVTAVADLSGLLSFAEKAEAGTNVLNGIAYDADSKRLFVTGKNWPKLFEIELVETVSE